MSNFSYKNINKKTDPDWKFIADFMLYTLPLVVGVVATMPVPALTQKWILVGLNLGVVLFKAVSKFTKDKEFYGEASDNK